MKRVFTALSAGLLTCGLAVTATLAGATVASATGVTVTNVTANSGPTTGGTLVTITGTGFVKGTVPLPLVVNFGNPSGLSCNAATANGCTSTKVTWVSSTSITAVSPPAGAAGAVNVLVTSGGATSGSTINDQFTYVSNPSAVINSGKPMANLKLTAGGKVSVAGTGFTEGDLVAISICNSDAALPDPISQFGHVALSACGNITLPSVNTPLVSPAGTFKGTVPFNPGQQGAAATSVCPQNTAQAQEGVACIVGVAVDSGADAGYEAFAAIYYAAPAMTSSDAYVGEAFAGVAASAEYSVTLTESGTHAESGYPPVVSASGVPNNGGFATSGVICGTGTGPGTGNPCNPEVTGGVPTTCQASSTPGATAWGGETLCTYGAAVGEPVEVILTGYTAPASEPGDTSPLPINGLPFNCNNSGCSIASVNAGYGATDPGGFSSALEVASTGPTGPLVPLYLTPGKYSFLAVGYASGQEVKGSVTLLPGPTS